MRMPKSLYLIDGHYQIFRAFYAPFRDLSSPTGEPTKATHVFCQMLLGLIRDRRPDYLAIVLDVSDETVFRRDIDPNYKAHRDPTPEDFILQADRIVSIIERIGLPIFRLPGFEADDVAATIVEKMRSNAELNCYLVSRDKDLDQLLGPNVFLLDPTKDEVVGPERLKEVKGFTPEQAIEIQTLCGDTTDNVPGVKGIGPKTAVKLIEKYGTAEEVLRHAAELTPKMRENVEAFAPMLERTRRLVTLRRDVPIEFELESCRVDRINFPAALPIFEELGFNSLRQQWTQVAAAGASPRPQGTEAANQNPKRQQRSSPTEQSRAFQSRARQEAASHDAVENPKRDRGSSPTDAGQPSEEQAAGDPSVRSSGAASKPGAEAGLLFDLSQPQETFTYDLVDTPEALDALVALLERSPRFAFDTETTGLNPVHAKLVGLSFSCEAGRAFYVAVRSVSGRTIPEDVVVARLRPVFADPAIGKVGQNMKYDMLVLRQAGIEVRGEMFDTMVASFLLDPMRSSHGLDSMAQGLLGHRMIPITDLIGSGRNQISMDHVDTRRVCEYAAEDADYTWRLYELFDGQMRGSHVERLFHETEMPLVEVLTEMEHNGVAIDAAKLERLGGVMQAQLDELKQEVFEAVGHPFNIDSTKQLAEVLFDELRLPVIRKTKTGRSTDADTLEALVEQSDHPAPPLLLQYREIFKLKSTYVDTLPRMVSRRSGRIHASYHQTGAITGRLSSSDPNLQNIPIRTPLGKQIREAFVAGSPDTVLLAADYSQIELRLLAHFCKDVALMEAFEHGEDIHRFVASQVNDVPLEAVTPEQRSAAKAVNFGIIYGQGAFGLSRGLGISQAAAKRFIDRYFERYPGIRAFIDQCVAHARRHGYVETILGRRRPIRELQSQNRQQVSFGERIAVNTVVQGSAADLIKRAMVDIHQELMRSRGSEPRPSGSEPLKRGNGATRQISIEATRHQGSEAARQPGNPAAATPGLKWTARMLLQVHDELVFEVSAATVDHEARMIREKMIRAIPLDVPIVVDVGWAKNWLAAK
ncbi:MAG: DNA polymerase I [Phycisphaerales bacterium]|nr:DNA polymerase I [Phycisphaerales bacterium]